MYPSCGLGEMPERRIGFYSYADAHFASYASPSTLPPAPCPLRGPSAGTFGGDLRRVPSAGTSRECFAKLLGCYARNDIRSPHLQCAPRPSPPGDKDTSCIGWILFIGILSKKKKRNEGGTNTFPIVEFVFLVMADITLHSKRGDCFHYAAPFTLPPAPCPLRGPSAGTFGGDLRRGPSAGTSRECFAKLRGYAGESLPSRKDALAWPPGQAGTVWRARPRNTASQ
jgi:hypothetical protein